MTFSFAGASSSSATAFAKPAGFVKPLGREIPMVALGIAAFEPSTEGASAGFETSTDGFEGDIGVIGRVAFVLPKSTVRTGALGRAVAEIGTVAAPPRLANEGGMGAPGTWGRGTEGGMGAPGTWGRGAEGGMGAPGTWGRGAEGGMGAPGTWGRGTEGGMGAPIGRGTEGGMGAPKAWGRAPWGEGGGSGVLMARRNQYTQKNAHLLSISFFDC